MVTAGCSYWSGWRLASSRADHGSFDFFPCARIADQRNNQRLVPVWFTADGLGGVREVVKMMMTVDAIERLDAHAEEASSSPHAHAVLHQPGRRCVAQSMRGDLAWKLR